MYKYYIIYNQQIKEFNKLEELFEFCTEYIPGIDDMYKQISVEKRKANREAQRRRYEKIKIARKEMKKNENIR